jgi:hypothetical protein
MQDSFGLSQLDFCTRREMMACCARYAGMRLGYLGPSAGLLHFNQSLSVDSRGLLVTSVDSALIVQRKSLNSTNGSYITCDIVQQARIRKLSTTFPPQRSLVSYLPLKPGSNLGHDKLVSIVLSDLKNDGVDLN